MHTVFHTICASTKITNPKMHFIRKYLKPKRNTCAKAFPENSEEKKKTVSARKL